MGAQKLNLINEKLDRLFEFQSKLYFNGDAPNRRIEDDDADVFDGYIENSGVCRSPHRTEEDPKGAGKGAYSVMKGTKKECAEACARDDKCTAVEYCPYSESKIQVKGYADEDCELHTGNIVYTMNGSSGHKCLTKLRKKDDEPQEY